MRFLRILFCTGLLFAAACSSDEITGMGRSDLEVILIFPSQEAAAETEVFVIADKVIKKTTDTSGLARFPDLPAMECVLRINRDGYLSIYQPFQLSPGSNLKAIEMVESVEFHDDFESGEFGPLWSMAGDAPWVLVSDGAYQGTYCAHAGTIDNYQKSTLSLSFDALEPMQLTFWYRYDTDYYDHYVDFFIDGVRKLHVSGLSDWQMKQYDLSTGPHLLEWTYDKLDLGVEQGGIWLDEVSILPR